MTITQTIYTKEREYLSQYIDCSKLTDEQVDKIFLDLCRIEIKKYEKENG